MIALLPSPAEGTAEVGIEAELSHARLGGNNIPGGSSTPSPAGTPGLILPGMSCRRAEELNWARLGYTGLG